VGEVIITLIGPITYWWDNWDTPEHLEYVAHRELVSDLLVQRNHLVYRPFEAYKGLWHGNEIAQVVNEKALCISDHVINLTPIDIPSKGTKEELEVCRNKYIPVLWLPPDGTLNIIDALELEGL
jgi:hypothetical protein